MRLSSLNQLIVTDWFVGGWRVVAIPDAIGYAVRATPSGSTIGYAVGSAASLDDAERIGREFVAAKTARNRDTLAMLADCGLIGALV